MDTSKRRLAGSIIGDGRFYLGLLLLAIVIGVLTYYINSRPYVQLPVQDMNAWSKALDTYAATGSLLITLATGVLAGMGWFFTSRPGKQYSAVEIWPAIAGAICACFSIYFGYISSQNAQWLTENSIGTLDLAKIQWPRNLQFYTLLFSVFSLADFMRRDWIKGACDETSTNQ